ncbi:TPA: hypothetical protein ACGCHH_000651 [Stenotrophomonas maltophilia]
MDKARLARLFASIETLTETQIAWLEGVIAQLSRPHDFARLPTSDIVTDCVLRDFGDTLRIHHAFSKEAFSKDKFEYALDRVLRNCGIASELAPRGNPGHDITIAGVPVSLKTQANASIRDDQIWVSKFMEMGRGDWVDESHLAGLRQRFFDHMRSYERIFTLRTLKKAGNRWRYELVEIPKALLLEAANGRLVMMNDSRQTPKPGYCHVTDAQGRTKFDLYFDGGTERKLQIKNLDKSLCVVHATWSFEGD